MIRRHLQAENLTKEENVSRKLPAFSNFEVIDIKVEVGQTIAYCRGCSLGRARATLCQMNVARDGSRDINSAENAQWLVADKWAPKMASHSQQPFLLPSSTRKKGAAQLYPGSTRSRIGSRQSSNRDRVQVTPLPFSNYNLGGSTGIDRGPDQAPQAVR